MKSTISSLRKDIVELRQELDNHCNKTKEATKDVLGKWIAECEALRNNLKAAAAKNADQEQSIEVLKQELAVLKVNAAKKGEAIEKMERMDNQLLSELEQLEHYSQYLANKCRKKILSLVNKRFLLETKSTKQKPRKKFNRDSKQKLYEILLVKSSASKDQIKKHKHKMSLLTQPDAGGDKNINRAYQILINDVAQEAHHIFGLDEAKIVMNNEN